MKAASTYVVNKALAAVSQNGTSPRHCETLRDDQAGAEATKFIATKMPFSRLGKPSHGSKK